MTRYRKKPVEIEAVRFDGENHTTVHAFAGDASAFRSVAPEDRIDDPEIVAEVWDRLHSTWVGVKTGQWIIRGVEGELYPCAPGVFDATYEEVTG